jgi:hypothetical protein
MKLKEKYYHKKILNLLKEYNDNFGLLNESKKEILMDKLGIREELAQVFDEVGKKLSIWLANKYLKYYYDISKEQAEPDVSHKDILETAKYRLNSSLISLSLRRILPGIMDYIQVGLNGNKSSLDDLSILKIVSKSKEWHDSLNIGDGAINYIENAPILIDFRNKNGEGYYWADLGVKNSPEECERMGHCGRSSYGYLYSLRSDRVLPGGKYKINRSHLTAAIDTDGTLYQLKGPKNSKPKEEYHKYIEPLFYTSGSWDTTGDDEYLIQGFGTEYDSQQDFKLSDLPEATIRKIYNDRPELFNTRGLKRKLGEMGIIDVEPPQTRFVLEIDPSDIGRYLDGDTYSTRRYKNSEGKEMVKRESWYEKIISDDVWESVWDMDFGYDWESTFDTVNPKNKKLIESIINEWISKSGDEVDEDMSLEEKIEQYDDEEYIRNAITNAVNDVGINEYIDYLRDTLKSALEEYGNVIEFSNETIKIQIDLKDYTRKMDEDTLDEYYENCKDDPSCVFEELLGNSYNGGYIDIPKPIFRDYFNPYINDNDYNENLMNRLNEI